MLFDSSIRRELWRSFSGTLIVLLTVLLTMVLIRILSQATKGNLAPTDVGLVLSYTIIGQLPIVLALALFVCVVATLSRIWRDSEMVVWQSSGARQFHFLKPLLRMAWPVLLLVAGASLVARPWAQSQTQILKVRYEQRSDMARVAPGQFQVSADGKRVFFIDSHSDGLTSGRNVFMVTTDGDQEAVVTARQGQIELVEGQRYLVLSQGERTQTDLETGEKALSRFETARIRVGEKITPPDVSPDLRSMSTPALALLSHPKAQGEMVWRVGLIWAAFNMVLAGLSLAAGNTRRNSNWNLVYALLVFVVYFNLLSLSQNWVARQRMDAVTALLAVHGTLTLASLAVIWWRDGGWSMWRRHPANGPASAGPGEATA